jgi:hypothetical protein
MVNINSKMQARKRVREAQIKANEARIDREHHNIDDAALFLVELGRLAAVDEWEQNRVQEVRAEAERRRHEHRQVGAAAVARMQARGESRAAIAELAGVKVGDVRAVLKAASARPAARPDALGALSGAAGGVEPAANGAAASRHGAGDTVGAARPEALGVASGVAKSVQAVSHDSVGDAG